MSVDDATELAESCLLPGLNVKIGDQLITSEHFNEIRPILEINLQKLLDTFHANETELIEVDVNTLKFRQVLLMVLCEQAATNTVYQVQNKNIIQAIRVLSARLLPKLCQNDTQLEQDIFEYFTKKLNKDNWKTNIGAIHGFLFYCRTCYGPGPESLQLNQNGIQFLLSRALCFSDHFEPEFKIMALNLFDILISSKYLPTTKAMNVDKVVYDEAFKLIEKANELDYIELLWSVLYTLINNNENNKRDCLDFKNWSPFDDTIDKLLSRVGFEDNKQLNQVYMNILIKFLLMGRTESVESDAEQVILELRMIRDPNYRIFRWVRKLLMLFQNEAFKLGGSSDSVLEYLNSLHVAYLLSIGTVPPVMIRRRITEFLRKFVCTLMEVMKLYKNDQRVKSSVKSLLQTFQQHLSRGFESYNAQQCAEVTSILDADGENKELEEHNFKELRIALNSLLDDRIFNE